MSCHYARVRTDSMLTCTWKWSWHHHQPATAVLKARRLNIYCRDARFCGQQEQMWPTAVQLHTKLYGSREELEKTATFILQTQCSGDREVPRRSKDFRFSVYTTHTHCILYNTHTYTHAHTGTHWWLSFKIMLWDLVTKTQAHTWPLQKSESPCGRIDSQRKC